VGERADKAQKRSSGVHGLETFEKEIPAVIHWRPSLGVPGCLDAWRLAASNFLNQKIIGIRASEVPTAVLDNPSLSSTDTHGTILLGSRLLSLHYP
jgi:hypothetical protein